MAADYDNDLHRINILLVDDNPMDQIILEKSLESSNAAIFKANNGFEAIELTNRINFSLILCDFQMPGMSGLELLNHMKKSVKTKDIPVVFITNSADDDVIAVEAFEGGLLDIVDKSYSPSRLKGRMSALIQLVNYQEEIKRQRSVSESMYEGQNEILTNILPAHSIAELLENKTVTREYKNSTVMFADFSNFTGLSKQDTNENIVEKLNHFFTEFDTINEKYGTEKIKTIGDSYMSAGGVPISNKTNPFMVVLCALEMREYVNSQAIGDKNKESLEWKIKFGISTGDVVSGIIGKNKYMYDVWGDTVNVASRLEGLAEPDEIIISSSTENITKGWFEVEPIGSRYLKNWGEEQLFRVVRILPKYSSDSNGFYPNDLFFDALYATKFGMNAAS